MHVNAHFTVALVSFQNVYEDMEMMMMGLHACINSIINSCIEIQAWSP